MILKMQQEVVESDNTCSISSKVGKVNSSKMLGNGREFRFPTKLSFILTGCVLLFLCTLSFLYNDSHPKTATSSSLSSLPMTRIGREYEESRRRRMSWQSEEYGNRYLDENDKEEEDDDDSSTSTDYSLYSCHNLYSITPDAGKEQCQFAKSCNGGFGIWAPWVFCWNSKVSTVWLFGMISPFVLVWLVVLFQLLGTTAEDYFSPSLEMFSVKMGLPPRFAGVTLLALGNGAADVSATVNAISSDKENGYLLSLGALTGAAMFVGGVVSAVIVIVAGGVPCRGALVRDILALLITVVVVWVHMGRGFIGPEAISLFLTLYGVFVVLVLIADTYHRAVVLPRLQEEARVEERARQVDEQRRMEQVAGDALNDLADTSGTTPGQQQQEKQKPNALSTVLTALSNYDNAASPQSNSSSQGAEGWGVESDLLEQDRPVLLHGSHGILRGDGAAATTGGTRTPMDGNSHTNAEGNTVLTDSPYAILNDDSAVADQVCTDHEATNFFSGSGISAINWNAAWHDGQQELKAHANQVWEDIAWNGDLHPLNKFLLFCELPFTILRKATISIPCEGYYCRALVATSVALSPLWLGFYLASEHRVNILSLDGMFYLFVLWMVALLIGALVMRYAPGGDGVMALGASAPLALYGFIMAATWIDYIAAHLVKLLDFLGIILHIPGPIIGLTILAWGNSVADLTANITMARKGLANMAITACFAGPVFNILVGLGLGFSSLSAKTGEIETKVKVHVPVMVGFIFIIVNCLTIIAAGAAFGKGFISKKVGYVALSFYVIYVVSSVALEFSPKYGDS